MQDWIKSISLSGAVDYAMSLVFAAPPPETWSEDHNSTGSESVTVESMPEMRNRTNSGPTSAPLTAAVSELKTPAKAARRTASPASAKKRKSDVEHEPDEHTDDARYSLRKR